MDQSAPDNAAVGLFSDLDPPGVRLRQQGSREIPIDFFGPRLLRLRKRLRKGQPVVRHIGDHPRYPLRSEEHTSELQSLMRYSYAVFCLKKKITHITL